MRLTLRQRQALSHLEKTPKGQFTHFGSGYGSYRVALRSLRHRAPNLVKYEVGIEGAEFFSITDDGRALLAELQASK